VQQQIILLFRARPKNLLTAVDKVSFLQLNVQTSYNQVIKRNPHQQSIPQKEGIATNGK